MIVSDDFVKWKEKENIVPIDIPEKNEYIWALMNIEHSWTGRMDVQIANTFIMESVQLICNAIVLFEQGYFDCAYYSLRQSIEVSTTIIYLSDIPEELREEKLKAWKRTKDFPMQGQMLNYLKEKGYIFSDLKEKLSDYFSQLSKHSKQLNKIVHKQGLKYFYLSRNHPMNKKEELTNFYLSEFKTYIEICIGSVAIMRLAIDPYPILLMDPEIYHRSFDSMTDAYTEEFVEKYIGNQVLSKYKKTDFYISYYEQHMQEEKKHPCVSDVVKLKYIDKEQMDLIISQIHLVSSPDRCAVMLTSWCEKIAKTYCYGGWMPYYTNTKTNRKATSWSGMDFKAFSENDKKYNQLYDEAFISVFNIQGEDFFIEHNEILTESEIKKINNNIATMNLENK